MPFRCNIAPNGSVGLPDVFVSGGWHGSPSPLVALALLCTAPADARVSANTAALQVALRAKGLYGGSVDGVAGPGTRAAVRALQARRGLAVDGIAGPRTRRALGRRGRPRLGSRALSAPARGWDVAALQFLLARHGFPSGPVDGGLGARTDAALRRFQAWAGLGADGVAGPATLAALRRSPPRSILRFRAPLRGRADRPLRPARRDVPHGPGLPRADGHARRGGRAAAAWSPSAGRTATGAWSSSATGSA